MIDPKGGPFKQITVESADGRVEVFRPEPGMHFVVMSWREENEGLPEKPGLLMMHCGADVCAKMIDRLFHHHPTVWENINKLWAFHEHVIEAQKRLAEKRAEKYKGVGPKDGKWN
jgi:hypothetical protein